MNRIIIQGAGFADNFGDVLFYDIFLRESERENVEVDLINISEKVKRHLSYKNVKKENLIKRIKKADGIVFIGGGYFGEPPHLKNFQKFKWGIATIKNILYIGILAMLFRKKIIVIGVGAGPISNFLTKWIVKMIANYSEKTIVRDVESYEFLKKIGVNESKLFESTDTALILKNYYKIKDTKENDAKSIVLHLSKNPRKSPETMMIVQEVEDFISKNPRYKIKAITDHNSLDQIETIDYLELRFKGKIETHIYKSPEGLINFLNNASVVITNKLHIAIVSATLGKSVISVPYHAKVKRFFNQINQQERCILLNDLKKGHISTLLEKFHETPIILDSSLIDKAICNINYFRKFISSK